MAKPLTQAEIDAKVAKLPKWAQEEIALLQRHLVEAQDELDDLREGKIGEPGSDTFANPYSKTPLNLPNGETIGFRLGADCTIHATAVEEGLEIRATSGSLVVHPKVTNTVIIEGRGY